MIGSDPTCARKQRTDRCRWIVVKRSHNTNQGTRYKLFSTDRFSYIVPTMAGHDGRKNLVLHASNYIVHLYPTVQESSPVLIVIAAYSDSVTTTERVLTSSLSLPTSNNYKASCLATCLNSLQGASHNSIYLVPILYLDN